MKNEKINWVSYLKSVSLEHFIKHKFLISEELHIVKKWHEGPTQKSKLAMYQLIYVINNSVGAHFIYLRRNTPSLCLHSEGLKALLKVICSKFKSIFYRSTQANILTTHMKGLER